MHRIRSAAFAIIVSLFSVPLLAADKEGDSDSDKSTKCPLLVPVNVDIHPDFKVEDRVEAIRKYDAPQRLTNYIACDMQEHNYKAAKPFKLSVLISDFRLRSGGSAFWLGAAAGADRLAVRVKVEPEAGSPYEFETNTSTVKGGVIKPDPRQRINYMSKDLARKIAKQIEGQGYLSR